MTIRGEIENLIKEAISSFAEATEDKSFTVEIPENTNYGDYATNIALILAQKEKRNPAEIAREIESKIKSDILEKTEFVNGFINFNLKPEFIQNQVKEILKQNKKFGKVDIGENKKIQVEFVSSNPTGPLTVANGRGGPFGDTLANVLNFAGYKAKKEFYINNAGNQVVILGHSILKDEQAQYKGDYIDELVNRLSKNKSFLDKDAYKLGQEAAEIITEEMLKKTAEKFNIKYDVWFSESDLIKKKLPDKIIAILKDKNLLYEQDNATWFKSTQFGDSRDRVLIKKDGLKTYLAEDIAYHYNKFKERKFDKVINVLGADHHGDVPGLMAGVEAIGHKGQLEVILQQFITVIEGGEKIKMSKRLGTYVAIDELLDKVGADVVRFFFLMHSNDKQMDFDLDLAREKSDKNPVFYVQYAYARINSILRKSKGHDSHAKLELLNHESEIGLIKELIKFPEIIEDTAKDYQVHRLPNYTIKLASLFHRFYTECHILGEEKDLEKARLALIMAVKIVLGSVLDLMGISKPEKM
jgi:arginyl-tRNA synthetase